MKYDFDKLIDRHGTLSCKWDEVKEGGLPMWIADMDFETCPDVKKAIIDRANHGIYGYSYIPNEWSEAIVGWWKRRHNFAIDPNWLIFSTGVIPSISSVVRRLTHGNDNVVLLTPVYNTFYNCILNNGARALDCDLIEKDGCYSINWEDLEEKLSRPLTTLMIVCNPQNPTGNIWSKEDLAHIGELAKKHNVTIISDEIHCDLTDPGYEYIPFASVNETNLDISITMISPGKSFNLAGINSSAMIIKNKRLHEIVERGLNNDECAEPNVFAMQATIAAYSKGDEWLDELRSYLLINKIIAADFFKKELPMTHLVESHATYLLWLDVSAISKDTDSLCKKIYEQTGLYVVSGERYHGRGFIRINVACPKERLLDGLNRLKKGLLD